MAIDQVDTNVLEAEGTSLPEFNPEYIDQVIKGLDYYPGQEDIDIYKYKLLHHSGVSFKGNPFELVYKLCRMSQDEYVTRISLVGRGAFGTMQKNGFLTKRQPGLMNPDSEDDYVLSAAEFAFRHFKFMLSGENIEVISNIKVREDLREQGLGSLFFDVYEPMARDFLERLPQAKGRMAKLIVRANSDPKGWTEHMAQSRGYEEVPKFVHSGFPTFVKDIKID